MINNGRSVLQQCLLFQNLKEEVRKYKKNDSDLVFIHIARFHSQKNQKVLIDAFNQLSKEYPNVILLILGDWSHCPEAIELTTQAGENIYIIGTKPNVADYLLLSDAFCLTSLYEGLPISLIEAISCGCVPICTAVGGIVDVVSHGVNGYLSVSTDATSYLNTLKLFLNQPLAISKETLINLYKNNYSISQSAVLHISLYHKNK
jgi:glycosyltransferase involved in cell wall biosynthesis